MKAEITEISFSPGGSSARGVFMYEQRAVFAPASLLPASPGPSPVCSSPNESNRLLQKHKMRRQYFQKLPLKLWQRFRVVMFPSVKLFMYECLHSGFIGLDCTHICVGSMTVNPMFSVCYLQDGGKWV